MSGLPTVDELTRFLKEDSVVAASVDMAAAAAGVMRANDDLVVVGEEDVARLVHLGLNGLEELRVAFNAREAAVARLLAAWREDSDSPLTPQEVLWALSYILAGQGNDPAEHIRALVDSEQWWQRITEGHRGRFLDRIVSQVVASVDAKNTD